MVRDEVLRALEAQRGACFSGEALAERLGVSRAAVWKAVDRLRSEGLLIDAVPGEGYCLRAEDDSLTAEAIRTCLHTNALGKEMLIVRETDSTSSKIKREYPSAPHGFTVLAEMQTAGRGRLGRSFLSPAGSGLYMSMLLRPQIPLSRLNFITLAAAVAVCRAVRDTAGFSPSIKWVNDVLMDGKKLCGILTEASIEGETGAVDFAVLGIGINLRFDDGTLPPELKEVVGCLADFSPIIPRRAVLAATVLNHFETLYSLIEEGETKLLLAAYRELLCMLGSTIRVITPTGEYEAVAEDIDENGHLSVRCRNNQLQTLSSGEISIRF